MVGKPIIQTRVSKQEDAPHLTRWLMQPGVLKWFPMCDQREVNDAVKVWMNYAKKGAAFTTLCKKKPCGMANLYIQNVKKLAHQCLFSIIVDEKYRGQGIGTVMLKNLLNTAKEKFHIQLIHLEVYEGNPAMALYQRVGFKQYGCHKGFLRESDGVYRDKILMQMNLS